MHSPTLYTNFYTTYIYEPARFIFGLAKRLLIVGTQARKDCNSATIGETILGSAFMLCRSECGGEWAFFRSYPLALLSASSATTCDRASAKKWTFYTFAHLALVAA